MIIAVDFDGTCVTHEYPDVGKDIGAVPVLKWLVEQGHELILYTMRGDVQDHPEVGKIGDLVDAVNWFSRNGVPLHGINSNPTQSSWTESPKVYANIYIDDAALGCPLKFNPDLSPRPFVDWGRVKVLLEDIFKGSNPFIGYTTVFREGDLCL